MTTADEQAWHTLRQRIQKGIYALKKNLYIDPNAEDTVIVCSPQTWQFLYNWLEQQNLKFDQPINVLVPQTKYAAVMQHEVQVLVIGGLRVVPDEKFSASQLAFRTESVIP